MKAKQIKFEIPENEKIPGYLPREEIRETLKLGPFFDKLEKEEQDEMIEEIFDNIYNRYQKQQAEEQAEKQAA